MDGRWACLALDARARKALDFAAITNRDPASLLLERYVLKELERQRRIENGWQQALIGMSTMQGYEVEKNSKFYYRHFPWEQPLSDKPLTVENQSRILDWLNQNSLTSGCTDADSQ